MFSISAISQERHLELVNEKSDNYDSADAYGLNYQEKLLEGNGSVDSPFKIEVRIQNNSDKTFEGIIRLELAANGDADFYLPGFMYGTNRGDKPWKVDCKFPRLNSSFTNPSGSDCPLSSFYMVRGDRLSHPCALMYIDGKKPNVSQPKIRGFTLRHIIAKKILCSTADLPVIQKDNVSAIPLVMKTRHGFLCSHIQFFQDRLRETILRFRQIRQ